ncbi:hypothetical protein ACFLQ2_03920 [archaeon]
MELKHYIMAAVIIGLLIILLVPMGSEYHDCGVDRDCFKNYSGNCEKAVFRTEENEVTTTMRVEGLKDTECGLSVEIEGDGRSEDMICWFPFNVTDFDAVNMAESCSGPLADTLEEQGRLMREELNKLSQTNLGCVPATLWEANYSTFIINGVVQKGDVSYCHTSMDFHVPGKLDAASIEYYFNITDEEIYLDYTHKDYGDLSTWCDFEETTLYSEVGTSKSMPFEFKNINGTDWCHVAFYSHVYGMPEVETHLFISNNETQAATRTSKGIVKERVFR